MDYTRSPGTTASAAIDPVFSATQITNMAGEADYPWYWTGTTHLKYTGVDDQGSYICFGRGMGTMDGTTIIDVHGAGCQRSDPKSGAPADYPSSGHGPQGDVQRVFNVVRIVRDAPDPNADADGDGQTYAEEQLAGTDPEDPNSVFALTIDPTTLSWPHAQSRYYTLEGCSNLAEGIWFPVDGTTLGSITYTADYDVIFYRLKVVEEVR